MTTLTGTLRDSGGNPITGSLWLELSQPGTFSPGSILVTPLQPSVFTLTAGVITGPGPGPYQVYGNDGITPSSTWYALTAFDSSGQQVLRVNVRIEGASVDLGALTIAPTQNWTPPVDPSLTLGGDTTGPLSATVVERIRGRSVAAPPWTPGDVLTVQGDGSLAFGASSGIADGDKGDLTVSGSGATWTIDNDAVTYAKLQNVSATSRILGRASAGTGNVEELTGAQVLSIAGAAAASHSHTGLLSGLTSGYFPRANGTASVVNSPLYTDGTNIGLNQTTPTDMLHATRTAAGGRVALFLESLGAGGYAAVKLGSLPTFSEFLLSSGYVGGAVTPGFSIRDTNAGEDRLTISNTTGIVDAASGLTVGGTSVSLVGHTHSGVYQPLDAELSALAGLATAADRLPYFTGVGTAALAVFTAFGRSLIAAVDAAAARTVLALGTIATQAANAVAITGGAILAALTDKGGREHDIRAYGAVVDGTTDDTAAISAAITAAAATTPKGVVRLPRGYIRTTGAFNLDGLHGLRILGEGPGTTFIRLAHASNDLFYTGNTVTTNLEVKGFTVISDTVSRTGGWVFRVNTAYNGAGMLKRSVLRDIELQKQFNGFWLAKYEFVTLRDILIWDPVPNTTGIGVKCGQTTTTNVNQGSELHLQDVQVYGNNLAGGTPYMGQAYVIEDCDAVYMLRCGASGNDGNALKVIANSGGHMPENHFFHQCVFDATKQGAAVQITGAGDHARLQFTGCWFASAGKLTGGSTSAAGMLVDATGSVTSLKVNGSSFFNNNGNGLRISGPSHCGGVIEGNHFDYCGIGAAAGHRAGIYIGMGSSGLAPLVDGNYENNSGLYSIETSATTTKLKVGVNKWTVATSYGVAPDGHLAGTWTPTLTGVLNIAATSGPVGFYTRIDDVVHAAGYYQADPTAGSTLTKVGISLPIPSAFTVASDLSGYGNRDSGASMNFGRIIADATNDRAEWQAYIDADAANRDHFFSFTYRVK